ncbi:hypothetical protein GKZ27_02155 [Enterorhabdus mucosicola]|uniref:Uncharacterized protein n=1 Tax=Adlercreutzia mucosicola TaxID=580026 RepID=A0A6N8JKU0_9ACTN|nr:hypothetical protein [Adlercreutzia mucosicola]NBJ66521.1 hypothetical protein [Adlercreutzia caecimuris]
MTRERLEPLLRSGGVRRLEDTGERAVQSSFGIKWGAESRRPWHTRRRLTGKRIVRQLGKRAAT